MAIIIKILQTINAGKDVEKTEPSYTVGGKVNWYSQYGEEYRVFWKKTKNRATIWSSNPISGYIYKEKHGSKGYMHPNVHCSVVYNSQDVEAN